MSEHSDPVSDLRQRKQSVGAVKFKDDSGNTRVIDLSEMSEADRELAEKFGYTPVSGRFIKPTTKLTSNRSSSANLDISQPSPSQSVSVVCLRPSPPLTSIVSIRNFCKWNLLMMSSTRRWRSKLRSLVLVDFWSWMYVHCCFCCRTCQRISNFWWSLLHGFKTRSSKVCC